MLIISFQQSYSSFIISSLFIKTYSQIQMQVIQPFFFSKRFIFFYLYKLHLVCIFGNSNLLSKVQLKSYLFCNLHMHRGEYRIRGQKKTEDDFDEEIEQQLKLSTHAKGQRRENSAVLSRKHQESSQNSRLVDSRANSRIGSSVIGSRVGRVLRNSRTDKNGVVDIEFNNVKWISIVSAYDSKRLKNVTVSKQSCQTFLKRYGTGIKNDAAAMALFKDIKRHFHSWLGRINEAFSDVIDDFLRVSERAPLQNFKKMEPILESISKDTNMMGQKLEGCLKIYENNDFRKLFTRFQNFNQFSNKLEGLIKGIYQSKHRIDELFAQLQNNEDENLVDKKVDKIIKKGVRQAEHIIDQVNGYNTSIRDRIISKVRLAINDMAERSLSLFHKVQGAKDLIRRLHKLITDSRRNLETSQIRKISKIFKAVIEQANKFQDFVMHFNAEEDHISPKLREKLQQYSESIEQQKRAVCEIQILFVQTVINQTIQTLKNNYTLNYVLSPNQHKVQYNEFNHTLQEISDAMLDQTSRGSVEGLIKHGKSNFSKLDDQLEKIKRALRKNQGIIFIDTQNGEIEIMEYCNLAEKYKTKIKNLIGKHEQALRNLKIHFRQSRLIDNEKDAELIYLKNLRKIVEAVNGKQRTDNFSKLKGLAEFNNNGNILTYGTQAVQVQNLMQEMNSNKKQAYHFNQSNPLKNLIRDIRFQNQLYLQSAFVLQFYEIINRTNEKNLIQNLTKLTQVNSKRNNELQYIDGYKTTKHYTHLLDRIYCLCLTKGLKKQTIKQFDDNKAIVLPETDYDAKQMENELKYRTLISQTIGQGGTFSKNKIKAAIKVMKDMISSFRIIQRLNNNVNGEFVILVQSLSSFISQYFKIIISSEDLNEKGVQCKKITLQSIKSLKSKLSNIELIDQQVDMQTLDAALKARNKIISVQTLNQKALTALEQISKKNDYLQIFSNFIFIVSEYIEQSKQIAYIALNQFKQPIWLGSIATAKDGVVAEINLKGYKRGTFVDQYIRQAPIVRKVIQQKQQKQKKAESANKSPNTKQKNFIVRQKSHQKQSMDEQMPIESDRQMDQNIDNEIEQDNIQEINDDMVQQINDNIEEDNMDEQINQIQDGVEQIDEGMAEDIDQQMIESVSPKKSKVNPKEVANQQVSLQKPKIEVKKESSVSVYQIIPHFRELEQIRSMFLLVDSTETDFWSNQVDYQQVEDFYHRAQDLKDRTNFIKSLQSCFSMFINSRFQKGIALEIKRLDRFVSLNQKFYNFGQKSWVVLFKVLSSIDFSYSLLVANKSQKQQIIQAKISGKGVSNFKKEGPKEIIKNFLERTFKSSFYKAEKFNLQDFLSNCFKVEVQQCMNTLGDGFHYIIKVIPQYEQSLPQGETHSLLQSLEKHQDIFCNKLVTGIDFRALMIQFWIKAINSESEDYYKPDYSTLNKYIKSLDYVEKKQWIGHYLIDFRQNILKIRDKIKSHKNLIDNTLFKIDSSNIWQCINNVCGLYEKKIKERTAYLNSKQQQITIYAICEDSAIGVTSQSRLSTFLQDLFNRSDKKQPKVIISKQQMINTIERQYQKDQTAFQIHDSITNLLNIMEIQHYYSLQPQFILKSNMDEVIFTILKNLNFKTKSEIQYQQIFKDLFEHKRNNFSNVLSLKKKIDRKVLTQDHIKETINRLKEIAKQSKKNEQIFKNSIINCQMSSIILDYLSNKSTNNATEAIKQYYNWLKQIQQQLNSRLTSKCFNLLNYVFEKKKEIVQLQKTNNKNLLQVEKLTNFPKQSGKIMKIVDQTSSFIKALSQFMSEKGFATNSTQFSIVADDDSWVFGLEFSKVDPQQYLKHFFNKHLFPENDNKKQIQTLFSLFFKKYIQAKVITNKNGNVTQISYQIGKVPSQLARQIRKDLVQIDDMLLFTRLYNQHRFNTNSSTLKKLEEVHTKIVNSIKSKLFLVELKQVVNKCDWNGLQNLQPFKDLFQCFSNQLTHQKEYLNTLIEKIEQIGVKQTDLKTYIQWFKQCGINQLKMQYYLVKSSQKKIITIFPVAKIQKDKSKSSEQINKFLSEIKLPAKYTLALQQGVSTVTLQKQIVKCRLADGQNFFNNQSQLDGFKPSIPDGEILLLSFYQGNVDSQKVPLNIGQIKLETQCVLNITQYQTSSAITCSIWKIAKEDYDSWKTANQNPNLQSFKQLRKKMRGLATTQQKVKDICVGQEVNFNETGNWLREELKKHLRRLQKQQEARKQRQRIERLTIQQSEQFLETIYNQMVNKESLPTVKVTFDEVKKFRNQDLAQPYTELNGYWKKILDSNKKIIEKIEQSKSSEQMNRISTLTKDYLKIVKIKLTENQKTQNQMMKSAKAEFSAIEKQREAKQQQKRKQKLLKTKLKQQKKQEQLRKKLSVEAAKIMQSQTNSLNVVASIQNTPSFEVKQATETQQQQVQESQQEPQPKVEQEQVDECQLILECAEFEKIKKGKQQELYMSYLIFLLEGQSRKDAEYYRCILKCFWKQTPKNRESLVLMN